MNDRRAAEALAEVLRLSSRLRKLRALTGTSAARMVAIREVTRALDGLLARIESDPPERAQLDLPALPALPAPKIAEVHRQNLTARKRAAGLIYKRVLAGVEAEGFDRAAAHERAEAARKRFLRRAELES